MNAHDVIRRSISLGQFICMAYLEDLTDEELLVRPVPGANHIRWQLGHLINSEHEMIEGCCPGSMPPLPAGFSERYHKDKAALDDPAAFHTKSELLGIMEEQRSGTLRQLEKMTAEDLAKPAPEKFRSYLNSVGDAFAMQGSHWIMHSGQWAMVRRKLGRPVLI